ncbi:MAG: peptidylprolyl isomerase [Actinomycetota bacterium]|nr:peptidylprolyl isomerase [Actinomycetota bacterium]
MTGDEDQTAWERVASSLSGDGTPPPPSDPADTTTAPSAVPNGWEGVARSVGRDPQADAKGGAASRCGGQAPPTPAAPQGWGAVASVLAGRPSSSGDVVEDVEPDLPGDEGHAGAEDDVEAASDGSAAIARRGRRPEVIDDEAALGSRGRRTRYEGPLTLAGAFRRPRTRIAAAATIAVIVVGVILVIVLPGGGPPSNAAFSYQSKVTTVAQFNDQVQVLNKLNGVSPPPVSNQPAYAQFQRSTAKALAVNQMIGSLAKKRGIFVSQKTTRDSLDQEVQSAYGGDQAKFDQALSGAGITEGQVLAALNVQEVENQLFNKVTKKVAVSDEQVTATFTANQSALSVPEQRSISHIVVASQDVANSIISQLQGGAAFATLAQQSSLDTSSKAQGGALGTVAANQLSAPFGPAAFAAQVNVAFGPIQEQGGAWDVGEVTAITPAVTYANDAQTQAGIRTYLTDRQLLDQWNAYLSSELKKANVDYAPKYKPTQPDTPPSATLPAVVAFVANAHAPAGSAPPAPSPSGGLPGGTGTGTTP